MQAKYGKSCPDGPQTVAQLDLRLVASPMSQAMPNAAKGMGMVRVQIPNMHCGGCVRAVTAALQCVEAHAEVHAELERREVVVKGTAEAAAWAEALRVAGFESHRLPA